MDTEGEDGGSLAPATAAEARDAFSASTPAVRMDTRAEREARFAETDHDVHEVDSVVWHVPPFADEAVAAALQNERRAAVGTLRRQTLGRLSREVV